MQDQSDVPSALYDQIPRWNISLTPEGGVTLTINDPGLVHVLVSLERDEARDLAMGILYLTTPE